MRFFAIFQTVTIPRPRKPQASHLVCRQFGPSTLITDPICWKLQQASCPEQLAAKVRHKAQIFKRDWRTRSSRPTGNGCGPQFLVSVAGNFRMMEEFITGSEKRDHFASLVPRLFSSSLFSTHDFIHAKLLFMALGRGRAWEALIMCRHALMMHSVFVWKSKGMKKNPGSAHMLLDFLECSTDGSITGQGIKTWSALQMIWLLNKTTSQCGSLVQWSSHL